MFDSVVYSVLGLVVFGVAFVVVDRLTPYHLWKEIAEDQNVALGHRGGRDVIGIS